MNQTLSIHRTLLDPEATDEEMLRMDDEGYVEVSAERAGPLQTEELVRLLLKFYTREEAFLWLTSPQPLFFGIVPLDMIAGGRLNELIASLRQIDEGAYL